MLAEFWIIAQALEVAATELGVKLFWANIQFIPILTSTACFYLFIMSFIRRVNYRKGSWVFLFLIPLILNILIWVHPELFRENVYLNTSMAFPMVGKTYGILFWIAAAYNYSITLLAILQLIMALRRSEALYRKELISLLIGITLPTLANLIQITGHNPHPVDLTPVFFGFSGLIITMGIIRYNLFDVVPIAHSIIVKEMKTGMLVLDNFGRIMDINPAAEKLLHLSSGDLLWRRIDDSLLYLPQLIRVFNKREDSIGEMTFEKDGSHYYYEVSLTGIKNSDGKVGGWLIQIYDITERKLAEEIIEHAAYHDNLTGLPNRQYFQLLFSQELALAKMRGYKVAVAFIDIDNFKTINDSYGHDAGDKALRKLSERLRAELSQSDIVGRIGGDEFAAVIPNISGSDELKMIGEKLLSIFESDAETEDAERAFASIGLCIFPDDGDTPEELLKKADSAMYEVKGANKNNYRIYKE
jgi:PAS domain S-box/diguanylate cyclase (GGDEF) domain